MRRKLLLPVTGLLLASLFFSKQSSAQNLLDLQNWVPGQGTTGIFTKVGQDSESTREWGDGPYGKRSILWKAQADGAYDADGGWATSQFPINPLYMYRYTVWIKKTNSKDGLIYFGCTNVQSLAGVPDSNPYFWYGKLPEINKWYLLVGYIHGSGDPSNDNYSAIYDGVTGQKVVDMKDFKFAAGATTTNHRAFQYYNTNVLDLQYMYAPRVEVVNGNEPSIMELLGIQSGASDQQYFAGKVGIKTTSPGDYDLAVNGKIRTKEVRVETANWADYVFKKDYELPTLEQTEKHIKEKGHLPGIPSEAEVKAEGIEVGDMNAKLLKKIEELTLYLIELKKQNNQLSKRVTQIEKKNK
ncbi:hypothetical protein [Pedobacter nutrimenti]|uniref:hypothetical protein n=1 Tax=Pedobacter nutrimenti TaxID=1241337 RepID=UPI0029316917|nr:hypothetical protein [Pedobacter nutrimenti]